MKRKSFLLIAVVIFCVFSSSAKAGLWIEFGGSSAGDGSGLTTAYSWATVDTFDTSNTGWTYNGGSIVSGSLFGQYASPYLDTTNYLAVSPFTDSATVNFGGEKYNYLGLYWGSVDYYNQIEILNNDQVIATFTGEDIANPADGDQVSSLTNLYVNFHALDEFDSVRFTSFSPAFELDNLAVGISPLHAPIPGAVLLGAIGIIVAGIKLRKYA